MNFYQAQDDARRRTKFLIWYYLLALIGIVFAIYSLVALYLMSQGSRESVVWQNGELVRTLKQPSYWDSQLFAVVAGITALVIGGGSLFKRMQLSGGGAVVAADLGGRPIDPDTRDADERKLMNVVEEMAIASGTPVPQVWIMDRELGINAFAAGTEPGNAVIGVTRGCVQRLTRPELQGVVAHEFSHILNGDMKMNMRLLSLLFGILMISIIGRVVLESGAHAPRSRSKDDGGGRLVMIVLGLALMAIGGIGVFFARMIQAAISRQREFLADASAVQFTMDPSGISNALKKIGGLSYGSKMGAAKASEASHMFFASDGMFAFGMASHPPLDVRIRAVEKEWDGKFMASELPEVASDMNDRGWKRQKRRSEVEEMGRAVVLGGVIQSLGDPTHTNIAAARQMVDEFSTDWVEACRDRDQAQAVVLGLLLAEDNRLRGEEVYYLQTSVGKPAAAAAVHWHTQVKGLHSSRKIAMIDMAIPTLRRLSRPEYDRFIEVTQWMIKSDGSVNLFEFMLQKVVQRHLDSHFNGGSRARIKFRSIRQLSSQVNILVSTMAGIGGGSEEAVAAAYQTALNEIEQHGVSGLRMLPAEECRMEAIEDALRLIDVSTPLVKKQVLHVCGLAVIHDGKISSREAELLRATADAIGCSIPPFVKE